MDADILQRDKFATLEARLQGLETRMGQMETQLSESLTVVYRAESVHARVLAKLSSAVHVLQKLVERLYRMVRHRQGGVEPKRPSPDT
jgi:hypothetical protein